MNNMNFPGPNSRAFPGVGDTIDTSDRGFDLRINDIQHLFETSRQIAEAFGEALGEGNNLVRLSGAVVTTHSTSASVTAGWVYYQGEVHRVRAGSVQFDPSAGESPVWTLTENETADETEGRFLDDLTTQFTIKTVREILLAKEPFTNPASRKIGEIGEIRNFLASVRGDIGLGAGLVPSKVIMDYWGDLNNFALNGRGKDKTDVFGWALCDGQNGTPDLRGRFVVGYSNTGNESPQRANNKELNYGKVGNTGGKNTHQLNSAEMPIHTHGKGTLEISTASGGHSHTINAVERRGEDGGGGITVQSNDGADAVTKTPGEHKHPNSAFSGNTGSAGGTSDHENRPPYMVLAKIMKL